MSNDFNPYHKWLGIPEKKCPPTYYELLGISLDEEHEEVIKTVAQRQKTHVQQFLGGEHNTFVNQLVYQIEEAEITLLNPEMRRDYDRTVDLFKKRRKKRQFSPNAVPSPIERRGGRTVGEESGLVREYAGIVSVLLIAFMAMAAFSFWLPWGKLQTSEDDTPDVPVVAGDVKPAKPALKIPERGIFPDVVAQPIPNEMDAKGNIALSGQSKSIEKSLKQKLAGTKWINSNNVSFEWTQDGRFIHGGEERKWRVVNEKRVQIIFSQDHIGTLVFDSSMKNFKQRRKGGSNSFQGRLVSSQNKENATASTTLKSQGLRQYLAGTKWVNSNKVTFEWTADGRFFHAGKERKWKVLDDTRGQIVFGPKHIDTLEFNKDEKTFKQLVRGGKRTFSGRAK